MAVSFKDYYAILGVDRTADEATIKKAYRKKARELHPDRNKTKGAEEKFRDVNEAYEVLGDPQKRARYDQLGANWQEGAQFDPSQFGQQFGGFPGGGSYRVNVEDLGDLNDLFGNAQGGAGAGGFSDFFDALFGGIGGASQRRTGGRSRRRASSHPQQGGDRPLAGADVEAEVEFALADLLQPHQKRITLGVPTGDGGTETRSVTVNIPAGLRPGQRLRLPAQGAAGHHGGARGDIYLKIRVRPDPNLRIEGDDLVTDVDVPAAIAVVGGTARVAAPEGGTVTLRVAPGTQSGTSLRVRGRGLPRKDGSRGDLLARVRVAVPEHPTEKQRELWQKLAELETTS